MRILAFCSTYPPADRGGTVRAMAGLVHHLGDEHDFHVFTLDRHHGANEPLAGIEPGRWQQVGKATVYYAPPRDLAPGRMARLVSSLGPDLYYVNSFLSPRFGTTPVLLRWLRRIPGRPMILAPRGEFHPAALSLKRAKKRAFIGIMRHLPAYSDLLWQAGSAEEAEQIRNVFPDAEIAIARDLTAYVDRPVISRSVKRAGELSVAYLSRVTPMKNLLGAIRMLAHLRGDVRFSVYGPVVEPEYFRKCVDASKHLAPNVRVRFEGEVPHERVLETLSSHHVFLLPTLGESFGHAILEALLAGCLLVVSDQTPWRRLHVSAAGWDLPLNDEMAFVEALQTCVDMGDPQFEAASRAARELGAAAAKSPAAVEASRTLFERVRGR